jgi:sugar-phosphatase
VIKIEDFEAVIFDMDGVLIDSEPLWKIAMEEAFREVDCNLTKEDFQKTVGLRIDHVIQYWFDEIGWEGATPKEVEERIIIRLIELIKENGDPLPGVLDSIEYFKRKKLKIGLATSSYSVLIETVLTVLDISDFFEAVHSAENETYGKPHPAVYITAAEMLDVNPTKCLVIEDSLNGIISGKSARMKVVCIPEKTHIIEPKLTIADYMFEDMNEMLSEIKQTNND